MVSRPTRARGLKPYSGGCSTPIIPVAPHAGAWIETNLGHFGSSVICVVAPHAGAWIETRVKMWGSVKKDGRAPRGRVD